jgi:hypothetical protein
MASEHPEQRPQGASHVALGLFAVAGLLVVAGALPLGSSPGIGLGLAAGGFLVGVGAAVMALRGGKPS